MMSLPGKMMSGGQPLLPSGNGGFGQDEVTAPTDLSQTFKPPSLLCPDYLMKALAERKHAASEYYDDNFMPVKNEPNWVGFNNNQGSVYTNDVNMENYGGLTNDQFQEDSSDVHNNSLYVGNLPSNCSEKALCDLFSTYGHVIEVRIAKKYDSDRQVPGFAFVRFLDPDSVTNVLNSKPIKLFGDHRLNVQRKKNPDKATSSPIRRLNDLDSRRSKSRSRSRTRSRRRRSNSRSPHSSRQSRRRKSRSVSRRSSYARRISPARSKTLIRDPKRRRSPSSQERSVKRQRGSKSTFREEQMRRLKEEKEYELGRLRYVERREERLREDERRLRDQMDGGKLREEEEKVRKLKRERLAREKKLHEREKSLMRLREEQEKRRIAIRRSVSRDRNIETEPERNIRIRSRSRHRSRSRSRGRDRRIKSGSEVSSSSRQTSSSRSVFDGNRLGEKVSVKTRLGKRRQSRSRSSD